MEQADRTRFYEVDLFRRCLRPDNRLARPEITGFLERPQLLNLGPRESAEKGRPGGGARFSCPGPACGSALPQARGGDQPADGLGAYPDQSREVLASQPRPLATERHVEALSRSGMRMRCPT